MKEQSLFTNSIKLTGNRPW